jgi:hypothetical protein
MGSRSKGEQGGAGRIKKEQGGAKGSRSKGEQGEPEGAMGNRSIEQGKARRRKGSYW